METNLILLTFLAVIGILIASYLIYTRKKFHSVKVCPTGGCDTVLNSKYSKTFGIRNDILGIIYYLTILAEVYISTNLLINLTIYFKIISSLAFLFSLYLLYIQARVLKAYCFYCILTAIVNLGIFIIIIRL